MEKKQAVLPKNLKQIGQVSGNQRVYIEDYVVTYLRQLMEAEKGVKISVLYGRKEMVDDELYWFVSGAIEAQTDITMEKSLLDEDAFTRVNHLAEKFFPDCSVLGWAIARASHQDVYDQMIHTQKTYFRSDQKVFFEYIIDEKQENVFLYEKNKMILQTGYYIYYDRNECMQNYMVSLRQIEHHPEELEADRVPKQFREVCSEKKDERHRRRTTFALTCSSLLLVSVIMIIGYTMLNNYEKMESMERVLYQISGAMNKQSVKLLSKEEQPEIAMATDSVIAQPEKTADSELVTGQENTTTPETTTEQEKVMNPETIDGQDKKSESDINNEELSKEQKVESEQVTEKTQDTDKDRKQETKQTVEKAQDAEKNQKQETKQTEEKSQEQENKQVTEKTQDSEKAQSQENEQAAEKTHDSEKAQESETENNTEKTQDSEAKQEKLDKKDIQQVSSQNDVTIVDYQKEEITGVEKSSEAIEDAQQASSSQNVYIVKKGDTLDKICKMFYGNLLKRDEICKINHIENKDTILYGQKLILPQ